MTVPASPVRLLLVEDSRGDRRLIREYLASTQAIAYVITEAASLAEAREHILAGGTDLILLDLGLPDSWGMPTFHEVRRLAPQIPIVVFTGTDDEEQAITAIKEGAKDYLVKGPLTQSAILRTLRYTMERSRLEEALRASEEKFRTFADYTGDWEYWTGPGDELIYINPASHVITGYAPEEFTADPTLMESIVHPKDQEAYRTHHQEALGSLTGMAQGELEFRIVRGDGQIRWIGHVCHAVVGSDGKFRGRRVSNRDTTDRHEYLQKIAHARDFYLTLLEDFPTLIWRCGPDGRYNWFNSRWLKFTGRSLEQEVGRGAAARIHPADVERYLRLFRQSMQAREPFQTEYRLRSADESWHWVIDSGQPIRDFEGQFVGYVGSCIDITDRKTAVDKGLQNELRLASLLEISHFTATGPLELLNFALQQAVNLTESAFGYLYVYDDARAEFVLNCVSGETMKMDDPTAMPRKISHASVGLWGEVARQKKGMIVNDYPVPNGLKRGYPQETFTPRRWLSVPIFHEGKIACLVGLGNKAEAYDDTDLLQITLLLEGVWRVKTERDAVEEVRHLNAVLEQRVEVRTRELGEAIRELESFSYSVSHDLRAPLRSLDGFSQALLEEYGERLDTTGKDYLDRIRSASLRMAILIDDLLQLSRVARHVLVQERVDLSALALRVLDELHQADPQRAVAITVEPGVIVSGDAHLLRIVLDNLIGNAWKFTGKCADPLIEFGSCRAERRREFFVRDNGAGFDPAYADKLFVAFQRLHTAAEFPGTGVGLTIVSRIIKRHGGAIRADGRPGKGAQFTFTLPEAV